MLIEIIVIKTSFYTKESLYFDDERLEPAFEGRSVDSGAVQRETFHQLLERSPQLLLNRRVFGWVDYLLRQILISRREATDEREESVGHTLAHCHVIACAALEQSELQDQTQERLQKTNHCHEFVGLSHRMSAQNRDYGQTIALHFIAKPKIESTVSSDAIKMKTFGWFRAVMVI